MQHQTGATRLQGPFHVEMCSHRPPRKADARFCHLDAPVHIGFAIVGLVPVYLWRHVSICPRLPRVVVHLQLSDSNFFRPHVLNVHPEQTNPARTPPKHSSTPLKLTSLSNSSQDRARSVMELTVSLTESCRLWDVRESLRLSMRLAMLCTAHQALNTGGRVAQCTSA